MLFLPVALASSLGEEGVHSCAGTITVTPRVNFVLKLAALDAEVLCLVTAVLVHAHAMGRRCGARHVTAQ